MYVKLNRKKSNRAVGSPFRNPRTVKINVSSDLTRNRAKKETQCEKRRGTYNKTKADRAISAQQNETPTTTRTQALFGDMGVPISICQKDVYKLKLKSIWAVESPQKESRTVRTNVSGDYTGNNPRKKKETCQKKKINQSDKRSAE